MDQDFTQPIPLLWMIPAFPIGGIYEIKIKQNESCLFIYLFRPEKAVDFVYLIIKTQPILLPWMIPVFPIGIKLSTFQIEILVKIQSLKCVY